tara:strand:+ start:214 stop:381 length:168 start_codon:yes stop_codon:yes gene_type:complete
MAKDIITEWPRSAMQSFTANDGVTLRYFDSGAGEDGREGKEGKGKWKPWLVMVGC